MGRVFLPKRGRPGRVGLALGVVAAAVVIWGVPPASAVKVTVCPSGPPACEYASIAEAVAAAGEGDVIAVAAGSYVGAFTVDKSLRLVGAGASDTTITGGAPVGVTVSPGADVIIHGVTLTGATETGLVNGGTLDVRNSAIRGNNPTFSVVDAGGIVNTGSLTLSDSSVDANHGETAGGLLNQGSAFIRRTTFAGNDAAFDGGAITNEGELTLKESTLRDNGAQGAGGLWNAVGASATVVDSSLINNGGGFNFGGIGNFGDLTVLRSTLAGNEGRNGGAIATEGSAFIVASTLTGNVAGQGGGVSSFGSTTLLSTTMSDNSATHGGGALYVGGGSLFMRKGTITGNSAPAGAFGGGMLITTGTVEMATTTLSGNTAGFGGGIANRTDGDLTLRHSLVIGNTAVGDGGPGVGGGVFNDGTLIRLHSTISGNTPDDCAGC
jgi:predicted outer membrane repeat protein